MGTKTFFDQIMKIEVYTLTNMLKNIGKKIKTKIVAKQGCTDLKLENDLRRPVRGGGGGLSIFLVSGDLTIMPRPYFRKKSFCPRYNVVGS